MHQIRYFLAVAELLNFTRAAERCGVSQPALTRAIQLLEHDLGGPLFHRERARTHLTELGRMMLPYLQSANANAATAKTRAKAFKGLQDAPLSIGVMCTIGPNHLLDLFAAFRAEHRGVKTRLTDASADALCELLVKGELDLAIYAMPGDQDPRFHHLALFQERFLIACAPGHRFEKLNAVRVKDLDGEDYVGRLTCEFWEFFERTYESMDVKLNMTYCSEREDWVQMIVKAGIGVASIAESGVVADGLVLRPLIEPEVLRAVNLVSVRGRPHTPAVGAFVRRVVEWRQRRIGGPASSPASSQS
jgi:LysR family transcriptional regulator, hydrogen peroxide-inducible genes activator